VRLADETPLSDSTVSKYSLTIIQLKKMGRSGRRRKCDPKVDDLRFVISQGDFDTAKKTLKEFGMDIQDGDGRTALMNAVLEEKIDFVKWLVDNGANINTQDRNGYSVLHFMAQDRLIDLTKYILNFKADLELRDIYGNTPLWTAVFNGRDNLGVVKMFLDKGAKLDNVNEAGRTPRQMIEVIYGDSFEEKIKEIKI
jgi:ankyrin repeat protein